MGSSPDAVRIHLERIAANMRLISPTADVELLEVIAALA